MHILDTNVVSHLRKRNPDRNLLAWVERADPRELCIAAPTVTELQYGAALARANDPALAVDLFQWLDLVIAASIVLPLRTAAARILGEMWAIPQLRTFLITPPGSRKIKNGSDLALAAIALEHKAQVVTRNVRDFLLIARYFPALQIVDPFVERS
jgi:predicted nucleic acid-binding protein